MTRVRFADGYMPWGEMIEDTDQAYEALHDVSRAVPRSPEALSVDGVHLDDRGFWAVAQGLAPILRRALAATGEGN